MAIIIVTITIVLCLLTVFIVGILFFYQKRQIAYQKNIENIRVEYEKNLLKTQLEIQEQTFQTISREIHDNINLMLTLAKLNLNTLDLNSHERSLIQVNNSIKYVSSAITDLTDISRSLNSDVVSEQGIIFALTDEIERLKKSARFDIRFNVNGDPVFMDGQKELFIFRIIQEGFNNILKHANAKDVCLCLHYHIDHVTITLADNGVGFMMPEETGKAVNKFSAGLRNMRQRTALLNGNFMIESKLGKGTVIKISIPY